MGQIKLETEELAAAGIAELNLIAQDTTQWGKDIGVKNGLSSIIRAVDEIESVSWTRLMYLWPAGITEELIATIAGSRPSPHPKR